MFGIFCLLLYNTNMAKEQLILNDFDLMLDMLKSINKIVKSARFSIDENGLAIYGAFERIIRCELTTNSIASANPISFAIEDLQKFTKILTTVADVHDGDYSQLKIIVDMPSVKIESKKIKTKYSTCNDAIIADWVSTKLSTEMSSVFDFTTTSDIIRKISGHSFLFADPKNAKVYLEMKHDMEANAIYATLGNRETDLNNEITMKFGLITNGTIDIRDDDGNVTDSRTLILDLQRLSMFNCVQSNAIKLTLTDRDVMKCEINTSGKNSSFGTILIYTGLLKN